MLTLLILPKLPFAIFTMEKRSERLLYTLYSAVKISFSQDQKQPEKMYWLKILPVHSAVPAIISLSILIWTPLP